MILFNIICNDGAALGGLAPFFLYKKSGILTDTGPYSIII